MAFSLVILDDTFISRLTLVCVAFMGSLSVYEIFNRAYRVLQCVIFVLFGVRICAGFYGIS